VLLAQPPTVWLACPGHELDGKPAGLRIAEASALTHACRGERWRADAHAKVACGCGRALIAEELDQQRWRRLLAL